MPQFDTFRINHAHLGKVLVQRSKIDRFNDSIPSTVKTERSEVLPFNAWRLYISDTLAKQKSLTLCIVEHTFK